MENPPTVIRPPPPPPQPPPSPPPFSQPDNSTNSSIFWPSPPPLPFSSSSSSPQIYPNPIYQNGTVTIDNIYPPPAFPDSPRSVDLSPLKFILALMAVITIPALIYAFFFAVKCPPWTSRERHDGRGELPRDSHGSAVEVIERRKEPAVSDVKSQKDSECPVCLSVFADGEDVKQLSECKHSFHATCIDRWLSKNNNCPVCRASVTVKRPNNNTRTASGSARSSDLHQGLPDAASLV